MIWSHTHIHTDTRTHARTHIHTHTHARTYAHARTHARTYVRTYVRKHARTQTRTHARTHTHIYSLSLSHTHTHTHTFTPSLSLSHTHTHKPSHTAPQPPPPTTTTTTTTARPAHRAAYGCWRALKRSMGMVMRCLISRAHSRLPATLGMLTWTGAQPVVFSWCMWRSIMICVLSRCASRRCMISGYLHSKSFLMSGRSRKLPIITISWRVERGGKKRQ